MRSGRDRKGKAILGRGKKKSYSRDRKKLKFTLSTAIMDGGGAGVSHTLHFFAALLFCAVQDLQVQERWLDSTVLTTFSVLSEMMDCLLSSL